MSPIRAGGSAFAALFFGLLFFAAFLSAVAGLEAAQAGTFDVGQIKTAAITSIIAGVIRLLQRFGTDLQGPPRVP